MNWNSNWGQAPKSDQPKTDLSSWATVAPAQPAAPFNPWDNMTQDELLVRHQELKETIEKAKANEMELRKYIVNRAFPDKHEGINTLELGGGYELKAGVKFNYKLADNDTVEKGLNKIAAMGNRGAFIAERLVSWTPNFLLTEYRQLQELAEEGSQEAKIILQEVNNFLTITDAAPTLEIREPKSKKK